MTSLPIVSIEKQGDTISTKRLRYLEKAGIISLLRKSPIQFVVANPGDSLVWLPLPDCFGFWKKNIKDNLAFDAGEGFVLDDFPGNFVYLASEWESKLSNPLILLECYH